MRSTKVESHATNTCPAVIPWRAGVDDVESLMAVKIQDVVRANLVLVGLRLLGTPEEIEAFRRVIGTDVQIAGAGLATNIQSGLTEPQFNLVLNKDRIALELSPSRSTISRDYPLFDDLSRLAEIGGRAISESSIVGQQLRAFGFNIDMVFDQYPETSAFRYLSSRIFEVTSLGSKEWTFVGGAGKLLFDDGGSRWTISMEPRFNEETESRVFLSANLHKAGHVIPTEKEIRNSLQEMWKEVHEFVHRLDGRGS